MKLAIVASHPVQYQAPLFRELAAQDDLDLTVLYCHKPDAVEQGKGFGVAFEWDVDLTSGYDHQWLDNVSPNPGVMNFAGCDTPDVGHVIQSKGFNAVIVMGWQVKSYWQVMVHCWLHHIPLFVRGDSQYNPLQKAWVRWAKGLIYPLFIQAFDAVLPYGTRSSDYFRRFGARNVYTSPHFIDNDWFKEKKISQQGARKRLRINEDHHVFAFIGKFEPKKRPMDIIRAFEGVSKTCDKAALLMVGDGDLKQECEDYVAKHKLNIRFEGFQNQGNLPLYYSALDTLVLASDYGETWGLVVNEAYAMGKEAIISDACGCSEDLLPVASPARFEYTSVSALSKSMQWSILKRDTPPDKRMLEDFVQLYNKKVAARRLLHVLGKFR